MLPEVRQAVRAVGPVERAPQAGLVVEIRLDDLGAAVGERPCCVLTGIARTARSANSPLGSSRIARASPPACAPVAPVTAMIFFSAMLPPDGEWEGPFYHSGPMPRNGPGSEADMLVVGINVR